MKRNIIILCIVVASVALFVRCSNTNAKDISANNETIKDSTEHTTVIKPLYQTDTVAYDTDDPAIWINPSNPEESLIIGTDKNENGALYVFDLKGKIIGDKVIKGLKRPNNVDIEYGLQVGDKKMDIAVVTERFTHKLRIFSLPDMKAIDNGGIPVFEGETEADYRDLMGIALYKSKVSGKVYAIVGRKNGPSLGYLWQYELSGDKKGNVTAALVRKFGKYSGKYEIESIAVDDELGYVYYSDETVGVRKYHAEPGNTNDELAIFGTSGFKQDHEGISIYYLNEKEGYILVSDQQANTFRVFPREGTKNNPHDHPLITVLPVSTNESDGSEVTSLSLGKEFKGGLFVAMSDNKTFQLYRWTDLAGNTLKVK